jgi:hypothetical protein
MKKMIRFYISLVVFMMATATSFAQWLPTANLTIFSEDGHPFFVILNGERQNDDPQTNIRIEELPQPYYNCKIIFADNKLKDITKNMLMLVDADGIPQDVTYRIKLDKKGTPVLRFHSLIPAQQNMMRPGNVAVYRFGSHSPFIMPGGAVVSAPVQAPINRPMPGNTTVQQTTTVQTTTVSPGVGVNVNAPGVNMNVNITDPFAPTMTTTTTTTRSITNQQNMIIDNVGRSDGLDSLQCSHEQSRFFLKH